MRKCLLIVLTNFYNCFILKKEVFFVLLKQNKMEKGKRIIKLENKNLLSI